MKSMLARRYRFFKLFKSKKCGSGVTDQATTCRGVAREFKHARSSVWIVQVSTSLAGCYLLCCKL